MASRTGKKTTLPSTTSEPAESQPGRHLEALHRLAVNLLSAPDVATVLRLLLEQVDSLIAPDAVTVLLADVSRRVLLQEAGRAAVGFDSWLEGQQLTVQLDSAVESSGPAGTAFREQRTVVLADPWRDWRALAWPETVGLAPGTRLLSTPLVFAGAPLGILMLGFSSGTRPSPELVDLVEQIASTASPALHSALQDRLLIQKSLLPAEPDLRSATETSALVEIARTAGSTLDLSEVLGRVVGKTAQLMGADICSLWLLSEDGQSLLPSALYGRDEEFVSRWKGQTIPLERERLSMEVVNTGKPVVVFDAETDGRTDKQAVRFFGDKSILVVPLVAKGRILGTLFLNHTRSQHWYSNQDIEIASAIASQAAIAIDNARLYEETRRWTLQLEAMQSLVAKLNTGNTVSGIATTIATETKKIVDYDTCRIFLLRPGSEELLPVTHSGAAEDRGETVEKPSIRVGEGIIGWVAQTGRPQLISDVERDQRSRHVPGTPYVEESMIACPLTYQGRVTGVISLAKLGLGKFSGPDLRLLNILANQAAIAMENARLYQETLQKSQQLRGSFRRIGEALAASPDLDETTRLILDLTSGVVQADVCVLQIVDDLGQVLYEAGKGAGWRIAAEALRQHGDAPGSSPVREGVAVNISDTLSDSRAINLPPTVAETWRVYLGVPLLLAGQPIGTLSVFRRRAQPFLASDVELLSSFANHAAIAVDRSQLFSALQERLDQFSGLHELSKVISSVTSWEDTLSQLVAQIARIVDAERCVILLHEEDGEALVGQVPSFGLADDEVRALRIPLTEDLPAVQVWRTGQTFIRNTSEEASDSPTRQVLEAPEHSLLIVPMRVGDRSIGVIRVSNKSDGRFTDNDAKLLTILATQAATIVENAALYRRVSMEKDQLDAIFKNTSDAILIIGEDRRVLRVNPAASLLTNWSQAEAVGQPCSRLYQPHDVEGRSLCDPGTCPIERIKSTWQPIPYLETVTTTKAGRTIDVAASYSFFVSEGSLYTIAILRDISKVKEVDRLKSEFISMVSHEFRSPLALIKGYASTLLRPDLALDPAKQHRFLSGINEAVDRLTRLVDNLLSTSRIEAGRMKPNLRVVDLVDTVNKALLPFHGSGPKHQLVLRAPSRAPKVLADRDQIEQVLVNLVNNAFKYSPNGGTIEVSISKPVPNRATGGNDKVVLVSVKDEGIGIPEPYLDKVFERFFRVEDPRSRTTPGSGLGLYVCRSIIEAHGGSLTIRSKEDRGTTVAFSLPASV